MYKRYLTNMPESGSSSSSTDSSADSHISEINDLLFQVDQIASEKPQSPGKLDKTHLTADGNLSFTETQYKGDDTIT